MTVLVVLEGTLPSFCWSYKIQDKEATVTVLTVLAVVTVMAVLVMTATPLNPTPLFRPPEKLGNRFLSSACVGKSCVLPIQVPNPSPTVDKSLASMGP